MGLDLRGVSSMLAWLWNDRMDITHSEAVNADTEGDTQEGDGIFYPETPQLSDVPCRISFGSQVDSARTSDPHYEPVEERPKVFCAVDVAVVAGDLITLRRCHADGTVYATFTGTVVMSGRPNRWDNHQEFEVDVSGDA